MKNYLIINFESIQLCAEEPWLFAEESQLFRVIDYLAV